VRGVSPLAKTALYLLAVGLAAAVISPLAYWTVQAGGAGGPLSSIADFPFHRYFSRTAQIAAIVLLVPTVWWIGLRDTLSLGLARNQQATRDLLVGLAVALLPLAIFAALCLWSGVYRIKPDAGWGKLANIALTASVVALVEEALFRGVLQGLAIRQWGAKAGIALIAILFAAVHFIKPAKGSAGPVTWTSGFSELGACFGGMPPGEQLAYGFLALAIIGAILGVSTWRTRSLWLAIGLHAGWVFGQQTLNLFARFSVKPPDSAYPWIGPPVVSGMVPTGIWPLAAILAAGSLAALYVAYAPRRETARDR